MPTAPLPGAATDRLVDPAGVQVHDRGAYAAFDTPVCRDSHWGHRLELGLPPWEAGFTRCFSWWAGEHGAKGVGRAVLTWESHRPLLAPPAAPPGVEAVTLTVRRLRDCIRRDPPLGTLLRPVSGAAEWHQLLALEGAVFGMQGTPASARYLQWTRGDRRARIGSGQGVQLGAFQGARLVGAASLLHDDRTGRLQSVCVAEGARGQGIGGALVSALARWSRDVGGLSRVLISAERGGSADRLYAALGFSRVSTSLAWGMPAPLDSPALSRRWEALHAGQLRMGPWRHRDLLWVAVCALEDSGGDVDTAACLVRDLLPACPAGGRVERPPNQEVMANPGYHPTVTRAWLHLVEAQRRAHPRDSRVQAAIRAHLHLADEHLLLRHWTPSTLTGAASRAGWVAPELVPLPPL